MKRIAQVLEEKRVRGVVSVEASSPLPGAIALMAAWDVGLLVVQDDGRLVGLLSERDFLRRVAAAGRDAAGLCVAEVMSPVVALVTPSFTADECLGLMCGLRLRHLPVVEGGAVLGVVSRGDLVKDVLDDAARAAAGLLGWGRRDAAA